MVVNIPTDAYGIGILLALLLPGVVWISVRGALKGRLAHDKDTAARILQALVVSAVLDTVYLIILGDWIVDQVSKAANGTFDTPRLSALGLLFLAVLIPAVLAYLVYARIQWRRPTWRGLGWLPPLPLSGSGYESTPTAWDKVAPILGGHWIRVRIGEGKWVGGWYGADSFVSTYPEPRDIYIEDQHYIDESGKIMEETEGSAGVWVSVREGDIVEWVKP